MTRSRTEASILNMAVSFGGQLLTIALTFLSRVVFIRFFSEEYLGVNGLFQNILAVLSLTELGIGNAMIYSLYKPVADGDEGRICQLMNLYRRMYRFVALIVTVLGVLLTPFLRLLIKGDPGIPHLELIYLMYVANTVGSYLLGYKQSIIMANQKEYINKIYANGFKILQIFAQIALLIITRNYYLYLAIPFICTFFSNLLLSRNADRMYPCMKKDTASFPERTETRQIFKNISALLLHRIGSTLVNYTDNLIISAFLGLGSVGLFSNYSLVVTTMNNLLAHVHKSFTASIGNLAASEERDHEYRVFRNLNFMITVIASYSTVGMFGLMNPFIETVFGKKYLLEMSVTALLCLNYYVTQVRQIVLRFRDAHGLFWNDRYKPIAAALLNLVVSIALVGRYQLTGVLIGTAASNILINVWVEAYVLMRYGFQDSWRKKLTSYFKELGVWLLYTALAAVGLYLLCGRIPLGGALGFVVKGMVLTLAYGIAVFLLFGKREELKELKRYLLRFCKKIG